jgi:putative inorganic carbon (hco3(-)) transporter
LITSITRFRRVPFVPLLGAAILGLVAGAFPPAVSAALLGVVALTVISVIEPRIALLVLVVAAPLKTLIETEMPAFASIPLDVGQILFAATAALWIAREIALHRRIGLTVSPLMIPVMGFTFAAALSIFTTVSPAHTFKELLIWVAILAMMALTHAMVRRDSTQPSLPVFGLVVAAILTSACVQAVIGIYQFFGGSGAPHLWILNFQYFRAFGSFGQPNPFGAFMGLSLPLALGAAFGALSQFWNAVQTKNRNSIRQWGLYFALLLGCSALIALGLLVSWSRGAWVGFAFAALTLVFFAPRRRIFGIIGFTAVGIGGVLLALAGLLPDALVARFSDFTEDFVGIRDVRGAVINDANYAVLERLAHWQVAVEMANASPLTGIGFGAYEAAYDRYALVNWRYACRDGHHWRAGLCGDDRRIDG